MDSAHISVAHVSKVFQTDEREVVALQDINLEIPRGQFVCLLGPSGCGKSTLLNAIAGFAPPSVSSIVAVAGGDSTGAGRGMVFQEYALSRG
jgi:NitT/TauT family transport system ATP-binding protein